MILARSAYLLIRHNRFTSSVHAHVGTPDSGKTTINLNIERRVQEIGDNMCKYTDVTKI